jgi:phage shock protein A
MSIIDKLIHKIKGAANDALDATQDLGADARQSVRDLEENLSKAESALVDVRAEAELLKGKREKAAAEVAKWLQAATNAAGKDDGLARECLAKKLTASTQLASIEAEISKLQPTVVGIESHIADLRSRKDSLANQADMIGVRANVAEVEMKAAAILGGIGGKGVDLAATEEALAKKEAKAKAATAVINERSGASLEARVAALNAAPSIEDELAALKAKK